MCERIFDAVGRRSFARPLRPTEIVPAASNSISRIYRKASFQ